MNVQKAKQEQKKNQKVLNQKSNKKLQLFLFISIVALYLRLNGIHHGLPYVLIPEESKYFVMILYIAKNFFVHFFNPGFADSSSIFVYLNALVTFIFSGFDTNSLLSKLELNPGSLYMPLRMLSLIFGVGSVVTLYFIGGLFSYLAGVFASSFLAVSFLHVKFSQMFLPFSAVTFFSLLSIFFTLKSLNEKHSSERFLFLATIFALFSICMHYIGFIAIFPVLFSLCLNKEVLSGKSPKFFLSVFFTSFLVLNLHLVIHAFYFLRFLFSSYITNYRDYHSSSYLLYAFGFLLPSVGPLVYIAPFFLVKYKNEFDEQKQALMKIIFSFPVLCLGFLGLFHLTEAGYATLLVPFVCLAAGLFFAFLYDNSKGNKRFVFIVLVLFALWIPLKCTLRYNKIINLSDTRIIATDWIKENTSESFKIAWDKNSIQLTWFDPYNKRNLDALVLDKEMLTNKQRYLITAKLLKNKVWLKILKRKVDYVVINAYDSERIFRMSGHKLEKEYYSKIQKLKPIVVFNPYLQELEKDVRSSLMEELYSPLKTLWQRERTGPLIKIYKL